MSIDLVTITYDERTDEAIGSDIDERLPGGTKNIRRDLPDSTGRMRGPPSVAPPTIFGHAAT